VQTEFWLPSRAGNERLAMQRVAEAVAPLGLGERQLERLKTAVSEATLNAMEHGNRFQADRPVRIQVSAEGGEVCIRVTDQGSGGPSGGVVEPPDLDQKLAGVQSPRGWGRFLMGKMVDAVSDETRSGEHTVCLRLRVGDHTTAASAADSSS
jgi:anti-sigma regulatory factor (Ser/Thr protein kinase)